MWVELEHRNQVRNTDHLNTFEQSRPQQVLVAGDDVGGSGCDSAFNDAVVVRVVGNGADWTRWVDEASPFPDHLPGIDDALRFEMELVLVGEDIRFFGDDRRDTDDLNAFERPHSQQVLIASHDVSGLRDYGTFQDPVVIAASPRGSNGSPSSDRPARQRFLHRVLVSMLTVDRNSNFT